MCQARGRGTLFYYADGLPLPRTATHVYTKDSPHHGRQDIAAVIDKLFH